VTDVIASATCDTVRVASPQATDLADLLASQRIAVETPERGVLTLTAAPAARIGELAAAHGIVLHELTTIKASLEDAYLELTGGNTEYNTSIPRGQADQPVAQQHALR
jgi:ABC-type multidrug transport system, ATPase component